MTSSFPEVWPDPFRNDDSKLFNLLALVLAHPYVAEAALISSVAPVQVEGTLKDGRHFYLRHRHSQSQLGLGATQEAALDATIPPYDDAVFFKDSCVHAPLTGLCSAPECAWDAFRVGLYSGFGLRSYVMVNVDRRIQDMLSTLDDRLAVELLESYVRSKVDTDPMAAQLAAAMDTYWQKVEEAS